MLKCLNLLFCLTVLYACNPLAPQEQTEIDANFLPGFTSQAIGTFPVVTLTSLNGGELLEGNTSYNITWTATDEEGFNANPIEIYYSANSGNDWILLATSEANDGNYSWTTPNATDSSTFRIQVRATDSDDNTSSSSSTSNLRIDSSPPSVVLTSLTGTQILKGNTAYNITWTASDIIGLATTPITLEYSSDSGATWTNIATNQTNNGTYSWTTPAATNSTTYRVRVTATDLFARPSSSASTSDFTIDSTAPTITLTSLTGADVIKGGANFNITWTASDDVALAANPITLQFSSNSGSTWTNIATTEPNDGTYTWAASNVTSSTYRIRLIAIDAAGNTQSSASASDFTIDNTAPIVTLTNLNGAEAAKSGANFNITWTATDNISIAANTIKIEISTNAGTTWTDLSTGEANDGTYTWAVPAATNSSTYRIRISATDSVGNTKTTASAANFFVDSTVPTLTAGQMILNGGAATTGSNYIQVSLEAVDSLSNITHFCLKYNNNTDPVANDACWNAVNANPPNLIPSLNLSLSNFNFQIGVTGGLYTIYAWVKDLAGNISALTSAGAGSAGQDKSSISYLPGTPPTIIDILVSNTAVPTDPPTSGELTITAGQDVHIKWKVTDDKALPAGPITLYYTTDSITFTPIVSNLNNGSNGGCTVNDGGTTADDTATGCYVWSGGSPTSTYFSVRVGATDSDSMISFGSSTALNAWPPIKFLAGNTDVGLGASATSAMFFSNTNSSAAPDPGSFVVTINGTIFFRDINRGILKINPSDGVQQLYIPMTGTSTGDSGPATAATLKLPHRITLDYDNRLLIYDYDRIRRVETDGTINTIIGGGASLADEAPPLDVQMTAPASGYVSTVSAIAFFAMPNGNIYFSSENWYGPNAYRYRYYDEASGLVKSLRPTGVGDSINAAIADIGVCVWYGLGMEFDPVTSEIEFMLFDTRHETTRPGCSDVTAFATARLNADGESAGPHPAAPSQYTKRKIVGRNGKLYGIDRNLGIIASFDGATNAWTNIVGTGVKGSCSDGTVATSCGIDPQDAFITSTGRIFFVERGQIRIVDESNLVQTIAGQSKAYGDGGAPLSARFGKINDFAIWDDGGTEKIIVIDQSEARIREFTVDGAIQTIAGNGSDSMPADNSVAINSPLWISGAGVFWDYFAAAANGDIYYNRGGVRIAKLSRSTGLWNDFVGGGSKPYFDPTSDGTNDIDFYYGYASVILGIDDSNNVLAGKVRWNGTTYVDSFIKLYDMTTGVQTQFAGITGTAGNTFCADGTAVASCAVSRVHNEFHMKPKWDAFASRWIMGRKGTTQIYAMPPGGTKTTLITLPNAAKAFAYHHDATNDIVYYCASGNDRLFKYNITTSTHTQLAWPISSMGCMERTMLYSTSRNSLIFIYKQNGLYGVAEYLNP